MKPYNKCTLFKPIYSQLTQETIYKKKKIPMNNDQDHREIIQHHDTIKIAYVLVKY